MIVGRPVLPPVIGRVAPDGAAAKVGLAPGDKVSALDGRPVKYWEDVLRAIQDGEGRAMELTVTGPAGAERKVTVTPARVKERDIFGDEREVWDVGLGPYIAPIIGDVVSGFPAAQSGLRAGDTVVEIEGRPVQSWIDLAESINRAARPAHPAGGAAGWRARHHHADPARGQGPRARREGGRGGADRHQPRPRRHLCAGQPHRRAAGRCAEDGGGHRAHRHGLVEDRGGPARPLQYRRAHPDRAGGGEQARQGLPSLAFFTAVISVNLALLNLLPVPMLDGGHLLFFVCEAILGRPLSLRKREVAQQVGFVLLMMLMVYAVYNDLVRIDVFRFFR